MNLVYLSAPVRKVHSWVLVTQMWPISEACQQLADNFTKCSCYMRLYQSLPGTLGILSLWQVTWLWEKKNPSKQTALKGEGLRRVALCEAGYPEKTRLSSPWIATSPPLGFFLPAVTPNVTA